MIKPRVKETSTTTGTGTLDLSGAVAGFRTFLSAFGSGNQCYYVIIDGTAWEFGIGIVTSGSPNTLSRDTVLDSSAAGAKLTLGAGTKSVFNDAPYFAGALPSRAYTVTKTYAFSATPTIDATLSNYFEIGALTGNITTLTISNPVGGHTLTIRFKQDGSGNRTVAAVSGSKVSGSIDLTANVVSHLVLTYSTADSRWEGYWSSVPA